MLVKGMIFCEGASDQILISAYLMKEKGWEFVKGRKDSFPFSDKDLFWYVNESGEYLGIWQISGKSFEPVIRKVLVLEAVEHTVESICIITDHDDEDEAESKRPEGIFNAVHEVLKIKDFDVNELIVKSNHRWTSIEYKDSFLQEQHMNICYLLVPLDSQGALETYMLNAISEDSESKKNAIRQVKAFIKGFQSEEFLKKRRERVKAELSVSISVFLPDRMFDTMTELIKSIDWADFRTTDTQFGVLLNI